MQELKELERCEVIVGVDVIVSNKRDGLLYSLCLLINNKSRINVSVVQPECPLDPTDFVVVGLGPEYEPGDPELLIVSPWAASDNTPEVWSQVTGVQRKIKMFFSPGFLPQL